jgi:hypothetical protein
VADVSSQHDAFLQVSSLDEWVVLGLQHDSVSALVLPIETDFNVSAQKCILTLMPVTKNKCTTTNDMAITFFILRYKDTTFKPKSIFQQKWNDIKNEEQLWSDCCYIHS